MLVAVLFEIDISNLKSVSEERLCLKVLIELQKQIQLRNKRLIIKSIELNH